MIEFCAHLRWVCSSSPGSLGPVTWAVGQVTPLCCRAVTLPGVAFFPGARRLARTGPPRAGGRFTCVSKNM